MSRMPAYKQSGQGQMKDLNNIIVSMIISWGGYRSKLIKLANKIHTKAFDGDIEYYKPLDIKSQICNEESDVVKYVKMLSFDDETIQELCDAANSDQIKNIFLKYDGTLNKDQEAWNEFSMSFQARITQYGPFTITSSHVTYTDTGIHNPIYVNELGINGDTNDGYYAHEDWGQPLPPLKITDGIITYANPQRLWDNFTLTAAGSGLPGWNINLGRAILALIAMTGQNVCEMISQSSTTSTANGISTINQTETWGTTINAGAMSTYYLEFSELNGGQFEDVDSNAERIVDIGGHWLPFYWARLWIEATQPIVTQEQRDKLYEDSNGLFWIIGEFNGSAFNKTTIVMTVEGLKKANSKTFGFYMSQFLTIQTTKNDGSWWDRFVATITQIFITIADAILGVFLYIPILKQGVEIFIKWIANKYGLKYDEAKNILSQALAMIVMAITIAYVAPMAIEAITGGVGTSVALEAETLSMFGNVGAAATPLSNLTQILDIASTGLSAYQQIGLAGTSLSRDESKEKKEKEENQIVPFSFGGYNGVGEDFESNMFIMYDGMFNQMDILSQSTTININQGG